jgi:hypothetical protein
MTWGQSDGKKKKKKKKLKRKKKKKKKKNRKGKAAVVSFRLLLRIFRIFFLSSISFLTLQNWSRRKHGLG